jgi:hypothetical protein
MTNELKCFRCGGKAIYVDETGWGVMGDSITGYVACEKLSCMDAGEFYTVTQWNKISSEIDALRAELARWESGETFSSYAMGLFEHQKQEIQRLTEDYLRIVSIAHGFENEVFYLLSLLQLQP